MRPAEAVDVDFIQRLGGKVFHRYGPYDEILVDWFTSDISLTFLAEMENRPVGFAMLSRLKPVWYLPRVSELLAIAVESEKRTLGIGDLLMQKVLREAEEWGVEMLILHTDTENSPGQSLFMKHGFISLDIKKSFYPKGQDALMMYKDIAQKPFQSLIEPQVDF